MASLLPSFEYDIFISYRQKDNKHDGWVTEFVENLKGELESTFKEEISVYFDINPHDGLLETHDVDASLKDKLKCLIFIPIISRTYCDPKSFAWEHEFIAFVELASQDQFGLKVKLPNGNVASRVLPVRIHDLDNEDIKLCESVLGGVLRGIDFIYKESGIDKPLAPVDDEKKNLNNTTYRIQIIKVARAIKEIILGMKIEPIKIVQEKVQTKESIIGLRDDKKKTEPKKTAKAGKHKLLSGVALAAILIIAAILAYSKIFKRNTLEKLKLSGEKIVVAVMPFQNMTGDTTKNFWQEMVQDNLISSLSNSEELKVRQTESVNNLIQSKGLINYASITPSVASNISQKLDANIFISGSIKEVGSNVRVNAHLNDSKNQDVFKSFQIDGTAENILRIADSLSTMVKNFLIISKLKREDSPVAQKLNYCTNSPEAYKYFHYGDKAFANYDYSTAINMLSRAVEIDSNYTWASIMLSTAYFNQGLYDQGKKWCLKVYKKKDMISIVQKAYLNILYADYFETTYEQIKYSKQLIEIDDQIPDAYCDLGEEYLQLLQYDKAIPEYERSLKIYKKWGVKPWWGANYVGLGLAYHKMGEYRKEKKIYEKAEQDFPDDFLLSFWQAILSLTEGDTIEENRYIEKFRFICKNNSLSEASIISNVANIYSQAGILTKAEEYYRQALSLEPEKPGRMNSLAYFLIDKDRNINEGLELIDSALASTPIDYNYLHTKGWGLYKQGKFKEALEILQKSWDLRMKNAIYDYKAFLHLEAAKKVVANQKNN